MTKATGNMPDAQSGASLDRKARLIAFDLDGTLTQHKTPLDEKNRSVLTRLREKYHLLMVGAGSCERIFQQLQAFPIDILGNYGLEYARYDHATHSLDMQWREKAVPDREECLRRAQELRRIYHLTPYVGETLEFHASGLLTFPVLGTRANQQEKLAFDPDHAKRRAMYADVCRLFSDYRVMLSGSSSFDIVPQGYGKLNALRRYMRQNGYQDADTVYCGDESYPGGNDYDVYESGIPFIQVARYTELERYLTEYGLL